MSISKSTIKEIKSLQQPKYRQMYNKFVAEGDKACVEFIKSKKYRIYFAAFTEGAAIAHQISSMLPAEVIFQVSQKEMEQMTLMKTPSDVLLVMEKMEDSPTLLAEQNARIIYLDGVQDPGNVGTIIRIADWFGIDAVVRSADSADFFNPKVVQATMGSMNNVVLFTSALSDSFCRNRHVAGTYMDGVPVQQVSLSDNTVLVLGSEGRGISESAAPYIHERISIPGAANRVADSLNVAVATGVICAAWKSNTK